MVLLIRTICCDGSLNPNNLSLLVDSSIPELVSSHMSSNLNITASSVSLDEDEAVENVVPNRSLSQTSKSVPINDPQVQIPNSVSELGGGYDKENVGVGVDKQCPYFVELPDEEEAKVGESRKDRDLGLEVLGLFNMFSNVVLPIEFNNLNLKRNLVECIGED